MQELLHACRVAIQHYEPGATQNDKAVLSKLLDAAQRREKAGLLHACKVAVHHHEPGTTPSDRATLAILREAIAKAGE